VFLARVYVTLKPTVNDPQGLTICGGLHSLGFDSVESVRAGKYLGSMDGSDRCREPGDRDVPQLSPTP
jgi:phosphoribosylformylglycinamidine synthase